MAFQLGPWGLANLYYFMKVDAALWLPWALWAVDGLAQRKRFSGLILTGALGLSLLAGMVTIASSAEAATIDFPAGRARNGSWVDRAMTCSRVEPTARPAI